MSMSYHKVIIECKFLQIVGSNNFFLNVQKDNFNFYIVSKTTESDFRLAYEENDKKKKNEKKPVFVYVCYCFR